MKYLRYNGKDAEVPEKDVELIQRLIEKGYQIQQQDMSARLEEGDLAEVLDGPLKVRKWKCITQKMRPLLSYQLKDYRVA